MNYSLDEFLALVERVEAQGGERLTEIHESHTLVCDTGNNTQRVEGTGCDEVALFDIPYEDSRDNAPRAVTVCAVDDMVGLWPRFLER